MAQSIRTPACGPTSESLCRLPDTNPRPRAAHASQIPVSEALACNWRSVGTATIGSCAFRGRRLTVGIRQSSCVRAALGAGSRYEWCVMRPERHFDGPATILPHDSHRQRFARASSATAVRKGLTASDASQTNT